MGISKVNSIDTPPSIKLTTLEKNTLPKTLAKKHMTSL